MKFYPYNNPVTKTRRRSLRKNQTDAERKLWSVLRNKQMGGLKFFRQYGIGPYIIDFYCPSSRIAIEIDGGQHAEGNHKQHDEYRSAYLIKQHIRVLRFWNNEVLKNIVGVWEKIKEVISIG